jgi:hypothetical protein
MFLSLGVSGNVGWCWEREGNMWGVVGRRWANEGAGAVRLRLR